MLHIVLLSSPVKNIVCYFVEKIYFGEHLQKNKEERKLSWMLNNKILSGKVEFVYQNAR